jgi:hypothetical protein
MRRYLSLVIAMTSTCIASAQTPTTGDIEVRIMGLSFIEAPPGRDKNLTAFGAMGTQEKVEINALVVSRTRQFVEAADSSFDKGDVKVTAVFADKSSQGLGYADVGGFPKFSVDGKTRSINISINRLPDRTVSGLLFEGTIPVTLAKTTSKSEVVFDPAKSGPIKLGSALVHSYRLDGQSIEFKGNDTLLQIKKIAIKLPNGVLISGERNGWGRMNNEYSQTWKFNAPVTNGKLQAEIYEHLETVKHPVRLVVGRPW